MKNRMFIKRIFTLFICVAMSAAMTACGDDKQGDDATTAVNTDNTAETTADAVKADSETTGTGASEENPVVMKIGDYDIYLDEYSYYYNNYKAQYDNGDESFWTNNEELLPVVDQYVMGALRSNYAVFTLAAQNGITLDDTDKAQIASTLEQMQTYYGGEEQFLAALSQYSMTQRYYEYMLGYTAMEEKLFNFLTDAETGTIKPSDDEIRADVASNYARVIHILVSNDEGDDVEANKTLAQSLLERAESGEDFMALVTEYGEDPGMVDNSDGYYFTYNQMVKEFEDASFELSENEISGLVESDYGYHIIKRLPMEDEYITANLDSFRQNYLSLAFYDVIDKEASKLSVYAAETSIAD